MYPSASQVHLPVGTARVEFRQRRLGLLGALPRPRPVDLDVPLAVFAAHVEDIAFLHALGQVVAGPVLRGAAREFNADDGVDGDGGVRG